MPTTSPQPIRKRGQFQCGRTSSVPKFHLKGRVFSLPCNAIADGSIEAGLLCLTLWQQENPGRSLTRDEIAFVCGCSDSLIYSIENRALAKLKKRYAQLLQTLLNEN